MKLKIAYLYPELLNIYGDRGNITAIEKRCNWRNIETEIIEINPDDSIDPDYFDFYFIGGGQDQQQIMAAEALQKHSNALKKAIDNNAVFLTICGGFQLLGHYYQTGNGEKIEGLGIIDAYTIAGKERFIGNVTASIKIPELKNEKLVGFENHSGLTFLGDNLKPLGNVIVGNGNNGKDKGEGVAYKNIFGTYLHGSLLPKNPHFTDYLIKLALERKYSKVNLTPLDDQIENKAHSKAINRKY